MIEPPSLSLAEWIVLALVHEQPRHGFAIAALTAPEGEIGRAWHVPRPIVYRAVIRLTDLELVRVEATERGGLGPQRSVLASTAAGAAAARGWLARPVAHVRDVRSELLVKLALLERRGRGQLRLIAAQRRVFSRIEVALERQHGSADGFAQVLSSWRIESARASLRFLDELAHRYARPVGR